MCRCTHNNEYHWSLFIGSCLCMGWEMLITAQSLKIQMNLIEMTRMNARMPLDPQMHIFLCGMRKF